jgi:hypothetical protein
MVAGQERVVWNPALSVPAQEFEFSDLEVAQRCFAPRIIHIRRNALFTSPEYAMSPTRVIAYIPASDIAGAGSVAVTVLNPAPGGGTSGALTFSVTP